MTIIIYDYSSLGLHEIPRIYKLLRYVIRSQHLGVHMNGEVCLAWITIT